MPRRIYKGMYTKPGDLFLYNHHDNWVYVLIIAKVAHDDKHFDYDVVIMTSPDYNIRTEKWCGIGEKDVVLDQSFRKL
jgi:hypothetical protein